MPGEAALSVLIPVRTEDPSFVLDRLRLRDQCDLSGTETILTDDGSTEEAARELCEFCEERGWRYTRLDTAHLSFSLARTRNAGLAAARTPSVFFDDADMVYERAFFRKLHRELELLEETPFSFLSLPAVYLARDSSEAVFVHEGIDEILPRLLTQLALEDPRGSAANHAIQSFAPASAILAMNKETALSAGGYDEAFRGWGGEDRDFIFRLLARNDALPRPRDFRETRVWNLNDTHAFEGWRALHRLHGDYMSRKGLYAFHLYHEPNPWRSDKGRANIQLAARKAYVHVEEQAQAFEESPLHQELRHSLLFSIYADSVCMALARRQVAGDRKRGALLSKLCRDPHAFFRDAKISYLRKLRHLFPVKENEV